MHFQTTVPNWTSALIKMPDGALLKSVNDPAILVDGVQKWTAAGRDKNKLWTDFRHHDLYYPQFDAVPYTWDEFVIIWRVNFRKFVDATYLREYAPHVKLVEELNEYTDTRMVTDRALLIPRLTSAQAAAWVWNNEYRGRTIEVDGVEGTIRSDCRLVLCNSPIGNDIPKEYYQLSVDEDAPLGTHPYTHWQNGERDPYDFRFHSGRWHYNEQAYGIKPNYVFTECGPYGNTIDGWRSSNVMSASLDLLKQGMTAWWKDCQQTAAYQEGRILGPGAWFTSSTSSDQWTYYRLWESELNPLAELAAQVWHPGTSVPPPDPPPPDTFAVELWRDSVAKQTASYNPNAALQKAIFGHNFVPVMNEDRFTYDGVTYAEQAAEHLWTGERRVYYAIEGDWGNVSYINGMTNSQEIPNSSEFRFEVWPTEHLTITQDFGARPEYYRQFYGDDRGHQGIDIMAPLSTQIYTVAPGTITKVTNLRTSGTTTSYSNYGWHVVIEHDDGYSTLYAHLAYNPPAEVGELIDAGEWIGDSGNTGNSDGAHLHLSLYGPDGGVIDPTPFLNAIGE